MKWLGLGLAAALTLGLAIVLGPTYVPWSEFAASDIVRQLTKQSFLDLLPGRG